MAAAWRMRRHRGLLWQNGRKGEERERQERERERERETEREREKRLIGVPIGWNFTVAAVDQWGDGLEGRVVKAFINPYPAGQLLIPRYGKKKE